jgi:hypothetical protein
MRIEGLFAPGRSGTSTLTSPRTATGSSTKIMPILRGSAGFSRRSDSSLGGKGPDRNAKSTFYFLVSMILLLAGLLLAGKALVWVWHSLAT